MQLYDGLTDSFHLLSLIFWQCFKRTFASNKSFSSFIKLKHFDNKNGTKFLPSLFFLQFNISENN